MHLSLQDPRRDEYAEFYPWPKEWHFFTTPERWIAKIMNSWVALNPGADAYGFIADDIVLHTPGGLGKLEILANPWFIAYPNDMLQRHRLCTHFCIGHKLIEAAGWFVNPRFTHHFIDTTWWMIGINSGLLRYAPDVLFEHVHPLTGKVASDEVYAKTESMYGDSTEKWETYVKQQLKRDVFRVLEALTVDTENVHGRLLRRSA